MTTRRPGRGSDQFPLRLPDGMRDRISKAADTNGRSMNAEIVARLDDSFLAEGFKLQDATPEAAPTAERRQIRELQGQYWESLARENDALRKAGVNAERIILQLARAIMRAAEGDRSEVDGLIEAEKSRPILNRLVTVSSIVDEKSI